MTHNAKNQISAPTTASHLSSRLKRAVPQLLAVLISVEWDQGLDPKRRRLIVIKRRGNGRPERPERPEPDGVDGADGEIAPSLFPEGGKSSDSR